MSIHSRDTYNLGQPTLYSTDTCTSGFEIQDEIQVGMVSWNSSKVFSWTVPFIMRYEMVDWFLFAWVQCNAITRNIDLCHKCLGWRMIVLPRSWFYIFSCIVFWLYLPCIRYATNTLILQIILHNFSLLSIHIFFVPCFLHWVMNCFVFWCAVLEFGVRRLIHRMVMMDFLGSSSSCHLHMMVYSVDGP